MSIEKINMSLDEIITNSNKDRRGEFKVRGNTIHSRSSLYIIIKYPSW